jgi:hypothetical protein
VFCFSMKSFNKWGKTSKNSSVIFFINSFSNLRHKRCEVLQLTIYVTKYPSFCNHCFTQSLSVFIFYYYFFA